MSYVVCVSLANKPHTLTSLSHTHTSLPLPLQWVFYSFAACALLWLPFWLPATISDAPLFSSPPLPRKDSGPPSSGSLSGSSGTQYYSTVSSNEAASQSANNNTDEPGALGVVCICNHSTVNSTRPPAATRCVGVHCN
jgi:hypothetical protein